MTGLTNYSASVFDTQAKTDEILCDIQRTSASNMMVGTGYTETSWPSNKVNAGTLGPGPAPSVLSTASGIAVSGALIFNALAAGNTDAV